jgi:hypothetical protein
MTIYYCLRFFVLTQQQAGSVVVVAEATDWGFIKVVWKCDRMLHVEIG